MNLQKIVYLRSFLKGNNSFRYSFAERKLIEPQTFITQKIDDYTLVKIKRLPPINQIYTHQIDTPAGVLKKPAFHIFPKNMPQINKKQKYEALNKKITQTYWKSLEKYTQPKDIFHNNRKLKHQLKLRLDRVGSIEGKYKHYMLFKSYSENIKERAKQQYLKKGVTVQLLGFTIFPKGQVWMPTNQKYLADFNDTLKTLQGDKNVKNILDIGCGSGVLSFLASKSFKKSSIVSLDISQAAVDTCNITASSQGLQNVSAYQFDILQPIKELKNMLMRQNKSSVFDLIFINPPWLHAKKLVDSSQLDNGVYDEDGLFLQSSIKKAGNYIVNEAQLLRDKNSKIFLIYSDFSKNLGIQAKSVQQICKQNSLLIVNIKERPLLSHIPKPSPLNQLKQKSKIQLFEIRKS